jgi:hypothetical protein
MYQKPKLRKSLKREAMARGNVNCGGAADPRRESYGLG